MCVYILFWFMKFDERVNGLFKFHELLQHEQHGLDLTLFQLSKDIFLSPWWYITGQSLVGIGLRQFEHPTVTKYNIQFQNLGIFFCWCFNEGFSVQQLKNCKYLGKFEENSAKFSFKYLIHLLRLQLGELSIIYEATFITLISKRLKKIYVMQTSCL